MNKFEKHAIIIFCLPFLGLLIEYLSRALGYWEGTVYNILSGICTALWFGSMMWGAVNVYFLFTQKISLARKIIWSVVSLVSVLYTLGLLLWIEFGRF